MRIIAGSMGAAGSTQSNEPLGDSDKFETPQLDDAAWAQDVRRRELAMGIASGPARVSGADQTAPAVRPDIIERFVPSVAVYDLSPLPDNFELRIERRGDRWKVTAPGVHSGLWKSGVDLVQTMDAAITALAEMIRLDGPLPAPRKRRSK